MNASYPIAFVFATIMEAEPFLERLAVNELCKLPHRIYESRTGGSARFLVLICGMGPAAAASSLAYLVERYQPAFVLNCGVAGGLSGKFAIGDIVRVSAVADTSAVTGPADAEAVAFLDVPDDLNRLLPVSLGAARLLSQSIPVFDARRRTLLGTLGELIDMEGAAIVSTCRSRNVRCGLLKVVSDYANDRDTLLANLTHTSRRLADFITFYLDRLLQLENYHEQRRSRIA